MMIEVIKYVSEDGEMYDTKREALYADLRHNFMEFVERNGSKIRHPVDVVHFIEENAEQVMGYLEIVIQRKNG